MRVQYWAVSEGLSVILCEKLICFVEHVVKTMEWLIPARIFVSRHEMAHKMSSLTGFEGWLMTMTVDHEHVEISCLSC